ncbi:hypothetical protein KQ51_00706 [Candidatus Izimaplasma bacterium HR1]|jgi:hypothetical protein|uniref:HAAS signaling domain-containing protein n=1 Tax=Candidatus Izimoplasma sp. HR1 TaxID=1541959 RepID=UPI0004F7A1C2|nr:hypothetical protein KQ51_00706 [Candidatus Izimaplasma bacterium HR1]
MELLDRYLKQIERYLPFKDRKETIKELRSLILDQVDELVSQGLDQEKVLFNVITDMGEPREVASNYNESGPMISKEMEPILLLVFKIVSITLPLAVLFANALDFVFEYPNFTIMEFLLDSAYNIPTALYSLLVGYGFIFIIFYLIERFVKPKFEVQKIEFNPNLLPKIPGKDFEVSIFGAIIGILATCLALYLFNLNPGLIAIYFEGDRLPLFNDNFDKVLIFMNIGWFTSIILYSYYIYKRRKTITSKTVELIHTIYSGAIMILLGSSNVFNTIIVEGYDLTFIPNIFKIVMIILGIIVIIGGIVEFTKMFINLEAIDEIEKNKS